MAGRLIAFSTLLLLLVCGCAPRFHSFESVQPDENSFGQNRNQPGGNAFVDVTNGLPDTLLFKRKLNGGIGAQVVGNDQFAVVPTFNKRIYFLNTGNGHEITSIVTRSSVGAAAALIGKLLYYAEETDGDRIVCRNLVNGKEVWTFSMSEPQGAPIVYDEDLCIVSRSGIVRDLNRWLGEVRWSHTIDNQVYANPAVDQDHVYVGTDQGLIVCLDRSTGDRVWEYDAGLAFVAAPMVYGGTLYCGCSDGKLYALDSESGALLWEFATAGQIFSTPVAVDDHLLLTSNDRSVYCISAQSGSLRWSYETDGILPSSPIAIDDHFVCASAAGSIYIFDFNGQLLRTFTVEGSIMAPLSYVAGKLWVTTSERHIYCFGPRDSKT